MNYTLQRLTAGLSEKKIVLFGAGRYGNKVKEILINEKYVKDIYCFVDNFRKGETVDGIPVNPPSILKELTGCFVIVCNRYNIRDIYTQLDDMGLEGGRDYISYYSFVMGEREDKLLKENDDSPYVPIWMEMGYAGWREDKDFRAFEAIVDKHSLCGIGKLNFLWNMVGEAAKLDDGIFIEIGTWRGGSGCIIAKKLKMLGKNNSVFLCDTFSGVVKAGEKDNAYVGGEHADTSVEIVENLIRKCELDNITILQGIFPEDTGGFVADSKFAFAHIDVDVYQSAKDVTAFIWPRLLNGGIIVFDDYGTSGTQGMKKFLDEVKDMSDRIFFSNVMGQGVLIKK